MSFWNTSAGTAATGEVAENNFDPLPKGDYPAMLEEATVKVWEGVQSINLKARVIDGPGKNRVLFLGLKCWDADSKKRDRAINLLVKLFQLTKAQMPAGEPDDAALSKITNKPLSLKLDVWEIDGKSGNWLVNASEVGAVVTGKAAPAKTPAPAKKPAASNPGDFEDNIPF
jgi:hypothetical protein